MIVPPPPPPPPQCCSPLSLTFFFEKSLEKRREKYRFRFEIASILWRKMDRNEKHKNIKKKKWEKTRDKSPRRPVILYHFYFYPAAPICAWRPSFKIPLIPFKIQFKNRPWKFKHLLLVIVKCSALNVEKRGDYMKLNWLKFSWTSFVMNDYDSTLDFRLVKNDWIEMNGWE